MTARRVLSRMRMITFRWRRGGLVVIVIAGLCVLTDLVCDLVIQGAIGLGL
jgi:hypothetical protein